MASAFLNAVIYEGSGSPQTPGTWIKHGYSREREKEREREWERERECVCVYMDFIWKPDIV